MSPAPKTAAEAAGLQPDDIILSFDGEDFAAAPKLIEAIRGRGPGSKAEVRVLRAGTEFTVTVKLGRGTIRDWTPHLLAGTEGRNVAWLLRNHAISLLPAVSSLKACEASLAQAPRQGP